MEAQTEIADDLTVRLIESIRQLDEADKGLQELSTQMLSHLANLEVAEKVTDALCMDCLPKDVADLAKQILVVHAEMQARSTNGFVFLSPDTVEPTVLYDVL